MYETYYMPSQSKRKTYIGVPSPFAQRGGFDCAFAPSGRLLVVVHWRAFSFSRNRVAVRLHLYQYGHMVMEMRFCPDPIGRENFSLFCF